MTRTEKWRYKRVELEAERQKFATALQNTCEELMKVHSQILIEEAKNNMINALDNQMDYPLQKLDEMMSSLKNKKGFLCD